MIWMLFVFFIAISFLFSGMEAGLLSVNRVRLRHYAKQGNAAALRLQRLLENPERIIATILIVTNLANISAVVILARECVWRWDAAGYFIALALALPIFIFFAELLPKSLFRRFPYRLSVRFVPLLWTTHLLLSPVLNLLGNLFGWAIPHRAMRRRRLLFAVPELKTLTAESERFGVFSGEERRLIDGVVDFRFIKAKDLMIPLENVISVTPEMQIADVVRLGREKRIDRLPVVSPEGQFIGVVILKDVLLDMTQPKYVSNCMRHIAKVAPDARAYSLIHILRTSRITLAAVVNEQGEPLGIVSLEDTLLKLVKSAA